ncbi:RNA polymerase sigma factor [Patescibacteria group bacterium]|nr:RNA polymerase sigma factor [Patescibacteria group bacterium]MCL5091364.1 RNA polymerase sigma factor [Patescibacteria group bacterium]
MKCVDDKMMVAALRRRDETMLRRFYAANHRALFLFVRRQIKDVHVCEELVQDSLVDFFEGLRDFHFQCSLRTYLFAITRHKLIDFMRKKKLKRVLFSSLPQSLVEGLKTFLIDEELEKNALRDKINAVLVRLPNDYRLVLRLKYIEGEKVKAIARRLSLKFKAAESLIFRARRAFVRTFRALD